jgi:excisionase family DNA binding protein
LARGRKLPYFAQNFSPPPPYGLPEPWAASVSVFAERNGITREEQSMSQVVNEALAGNFDNVPELLTTEEVAQIFRVTPATVLRWVSERGVTCVQVGPKLHRFPKSCLKELLLGDAK